MANQNEELDSVKRKIRALSEKTTDNGCSEAEAMMAMQKVADLLSTFNLSMNEVILHSQQCITRQYRKKSTKTATNYIWKAISELCCVRVWHSNITVPGKRKVTEEDWKFFGLESDVDMAIYLIDLVEKSSKANLQKFKNSADWKEATRYSHGKVVNNSFIAGFGRRISDRLNELAALNEEVELKAQQYNQENTIAVEATDEALVKSAEETTGTALMSILKGQYVEDEFSKMGLRLHTTHSYYRRGYNGISASAGSQSANNVNLSRPVGGANSRVSGYLS